MATATKTWNFTADATGWSFTAVGSETGTATANGLETNLHGKNLTASEGSGTPANVTTGWLFTGTLASIFGIAAADTVTAFGNGGSDGATWRCSNFNVGGTTHNASGLGQSGLGGSVNLDAGVNFTGTTADAVNAIGTPRTSLSLAGSTSLTLALKCDLSTGSSNGADMNVVFPQLVLSITYTRAPVTSTKAGFATVGLFGAGVDVFVSTERPPILGVAPYVPEGWDPANPQGWN